MLIWTLLRTAAIQRHFLWNVWFEDGDDDAWQTHMQIVRKVYGW